MCTIIWHFFYHQQSYPATNKLELWRIYYEPKSVNYLSGGEVGSNVIKGGWLRGSVFYMQDDQSCRLLHINLIPVMTWQNSQVIIFISFLFFFFTTQEGVQESVMSQVLLGHSHMMGKSHGYVT